MGNVKEMVVLLPVMVFLFHATHDVMVQRANILNLKEHFNFLLCYPGMTPSTAIDINR